MPDSRIAAVLKRLMEFKASLHIEQLSDKAAILSAVNRYFEEKARIIREEMPVALEGDLRSGIIDEGQYRALCKVYGIEAKTIPPQPPDYDELLGGRGPGPEFLKSQQEARAILSQLDEETAQGKRMPQNRKRFRVD